MRRGLFVTGTDTNVGKTVACAALLHRYAVHAPLRYWKPVQTGTPPDDDTEAVRELGAGSRGDVLDVGVRLPVPVSPHLAARLQGVSLSVDSILAPLQRAGAKDRLIVEGAGGVLVPLNDTQSMLDVMTALQLPVVVVARTALGTINHTCLSVDALRRRDLIVAGVIMVGPPNDDNREAIERFASTTVVGTMPWFDPLDANRLRGWSLDHLDPHDRLGPYLR